MLGKRLRDLHPRKPCGALTMGPKSDRARPAQDLASDVASLGTSVGSSYGETLSQETCNLGPAGGALSIKLRDETSGDAHTIEAVTAAAFTNAPHTTHTEQIHRRCAAQSRKAYSLARRRGRRHRNRPCCDIPGVDRERRIGLVRGRPPCGSPAKSASRDRFAARPRSPPAATPRPDEVRSSPALRRSSWPTRGRRAYRCDGGP